MITDILNIYERRCCKAENRLSFGIKPEIVSTNASKSSTIVKLKQYYGLANTGMSVVLLPAFDEMCFTANDELALGRIEDQWMLFDAHSGERLLEKTLPCLPTYDEAHLTLELVTEEQNRGLYDVRSRHLVIDTAYDDVDCSTQYAHLWVRRGNRWGFVEKATGRELCLVSDMQMAYQADGGFFLRYHDSIICVDERGIKDALALRHYVVAHGGRGNVYNAKYHTTVWFDVYGNILT